MLGDVSALRAAAFGAAADFADESTASVSNLARYSIARSKYDTAYAMNKTEPLRRDLANTLNHQINPKYILGTSIR